MSNPEPSKSDSSRNSSTSSSTRERDALTSIQECKSDTSSWLSELLLECVRIGASDLHLSSGLPPYFRIQGVLESSTTFQVADRTQLEQLGRLLCEKSYRDELKGPGSVDGAVNGPDGSRFRFNLFRRTGQLAIAIRKLDDRFRPLSELGLPESLYDLARFPTGLVVVAGPTGSGKSTTIATLLDRINQNRPGHIVTIEDPIEYQHTSKKCLVNQRQVGVDTNHFQEALVASLRQDPDVILVGEIREIETIRTAITASETGHLVFTTVHAGDCVGVIERLVSVFPADEQPGIRRQLALVLRAVVCQHLLIADGRVHSGVKPNQSVDDDQESNEAASRTRVMASEVLRVIPSVANLIGLGKGSQIYSAMESGQSVGMQTLEQDLARLLHLGLISEATANAYARSPTILQDRVSRLRKRQQAPGASMTRTKSN